MNKAKTAAKGLAICAALALTIGLTACADGNSNATPGLQTSAQAGEQTEKKVVKIAYLPITHGLPLFVESELQKQNPDIQIELVKYGSWPELMDALNTGRVDGASVLIELAMKAKTQGIDLKAVALGHRDGNVVVASQSIQQISDLKGKTFAIPHRQSSHYILLCQMLQENDLSIDDLNVVELAPTEMPAALAQGQIDGYCVAEPFGAKAVSLNVGKVLYESPELWNDSICCALVLNNTFIQKNPGAAKELVSQYAEAGAYIGQHSQETDAIAKEYLNVDDSVLPLSMKWISYDQLAITPEAYADLTNKMKTFQILENPPSYEDFVDASLLGQ